MPQTQDLTSDLAIALSQGDWQPLRDARIFLTGGTGFFGCWLLESLLFLNSEWALGAEMTVLSRNPEAFKKRWPELARRADESGAIRFLAGDISDFETPQRAAFTHVIHAATPATTSGAFATTAESPADTYRKGLEGTRRCLELARSTGAKRFLYTSSGAVYGRQPPELSHVTEDYTGAPSPSDPRQFYGELKRASEMYCVLQKDVEAVIARCFAFGGAYLPLDAHYAIGNFVGDAKKGGPVKVGGDGTPFRSYLYGADLAAWLWLLLLNGQAGRAYNVGSENAVSIGDLARKVAKTGGCETTIAKTPEAGKVGAGAAERYVPSTRRIREELGASQTFTLDQQIERMVKL